MRPPHVSPPGLSEPGGRGYGLGPEPLSTAPATAFRRPVADAESAHSRRGPARLALAALAAGVLALAGCGGGQPVAPEVPGPPAGMPVPDSAVAPAGATAPGATGSATPTPTATPTPPPAGSTGAGTSGTTGTTGSTGTTAAGGTSTTGTPASSGTEGGGAAAPDSPTNDTPPPAGSDAQKFEDFCAQNPGAC